MLKNKNLGVVQKEVLTFDQESSLTQIHTPTVVQGGRVDGTPPQSF